MKVALGAELAVDGSWACIKSLAYDDGMGAVDLVEEGGSTVVCQTQDLMRRERACLHSAMPRTHSKQVPHEVRVNTRRKVHAARSNLPKCF